MENKLIIIGIDSLDPYIILKHRKILPNFSKMIEESPTFISKSIFPVDTIPAWGSIYTGLTPSNHGFLYVYDIFDPNLSDLSKLNINTLKGKTFWDYANLNNYSTSIIFPMLVYPPWEINGLMVSKSPFDRRIDWLKTEIDVNTYPQNVKVKYEIPDQLDGLWGGFPGYGHLEKWSELGKRVIERDQKIGIDLLKEDNDIYFIYFSQLDIIQHRLWRYFDEKDPTFPGHNNLDQVILDYYKIFDEIVGYYKELNPESGLMVVSDHGHHYRPIKTANINEYLRLEGYLVSEARNQISATLKKAILKVINKLNIEHWVIKIVSNNPNITKLSKSVYSSSGSIDREKSTAFLSNFAGIKSYPHGGINIEKENFSDSEYERIRDSVIKSLRSIELPSGTKLIKWIEKSEEKFPGRFAKDIYPDIIFELDCGYGVGWDIHSNLYGESYDHKIASGGHRKECVFLMNNIEKSVKRKDMNIIDITPTILDLFQIDSKRIDFDGNSIFK